MASISAIEVPIRAAFGAEDLIKIRAVAEALTELGKALGALADGDDAAAEAPAARELRVGDAVRIKDQEHRFDSTSGLVGETGTVQRITDEYSAEHVGAHAVVRMDAEFGGAYHFGYEDLEVI